MICFISSLSLFYAPYAPSIWIAWLVLLLSYVVVVGIYLLFCYFINNKTKKQ